MATPGLGSLIGGRPIAGGGQLALALLGFFIMMFWFFKTMKAYYATMLGNPGTPGNIHFLIAGALFFGASWLWSLVTSISLIREANTKPPPLAPPGSAPPHITNVPPKM